MKTINCFSDGKLSLPLLLRGLPLDRPLLGLPLGCLLLYCLPFSCRHVFHSPIDSTRSTRETTNIKQG